MESEWRWLGWVWSGSPTETDMVARLLVPIEGGRTHIGRIYTPLPHLVAMGGIPTAWDNVLPLGEVPARGFPYGWAVFPD